MILMAGDLSRNRPIAARQVWISLGVLVLVILGWLVLVFPASSAPRGQGGIVSLNIGIDEILLALVPPERVAALGYLADDPGVSHIVGQAALVPGRVRGEPEQVLAFRPDLVLVTRFTDSALVRAIEGAGVRVERVELFESIAQIEASIRGLATLLGVPERGEAVVAEMERRLAAVAARLPPERPRVLELSWSGFTSGRGTTIDDIVTRAGGTNVAAVNGVEGVRHLSLEAILRWNPQVLLESDYGPRGPDFGGTLLTHPALAKTPAGRLGRRLIVPGKSLIAVSQYVVQGVEEVAWALHPASRP